jgi:hypothetical protein
LTRSKITIFASPLLCLGLLGGIVAEDRTHLKPSDVEPYHARARNVIKEWPMVIHDKDGDWNTSKDERLPASAELLLHPNCEISRGYTSDSIRVNGQLAQASLLIVQCKDSRDMAGHYPPICYPAAGQPKIGMERPFKMSFPGMDVEGMEYLFLQKPLPVSRQCVYDFFIVPGQGSRPDMDTLQVAAKDYQRRYYGAAQFQVVMDADYPQELRENIFRTIIGANARALSVLNTVEAK